MMNRQTLSWTTNGSGAATTLSTQAVLGKLYAVEYRPGSTVTGATFVLTCEADTSKALLTKASAGTANSWYYPREVMQAVADGADLDGTAGGDCVTPILNGYPKVVISSGGATKSGSLILYYED